MKFKSLFYLFLFFLIFFLILIFNFFPFISKPVKNFFYLFSDPIQKFFWRLGGKTSNFFSGILKSVELKKENERLNFENQNLLKEISFLKELERENKILREALEIGLKEDYKLIFANVVGKESSPDFFRVDKGKKDGVEKDFPVITQERALCGKISEVFDNFSRAILPTEKDFSFTVKISGFDGIFPAKGLGNSKISLGFIPKEMEINPGDLVITSAEGGFFPKELLVGKIEEIQKSDLEPFQQAKVNLSCQIEKIESLFIIKEW